MSLMISSTVEIFENLGIPLGLLILVSLAIWRILVYIGNKVVSPLVTSHTDFLQEMRDKGKIDSDNIKSQAEASQKHAEIIESVLKLEVSENESLDTLHIKVDKLLERADKRRGSG